MFIDRDAGGNERMVFATEQDCAPIVKRNRVLLNAGSPTTRLNPGDGWRHVASIPLAVCESWAKQGAMIWRPEDFKLITKLLNDSEYRDFRTAPGRI